MKLKITIILLTLFAMTVKGMAQEIQHDTLPPPPTTTDTVADMTQAAGDTIVLVDKTLGKPRLKAGIRIGINEADMVYSHEPIGRYGHTWQTGSMLGIFAETPLWNTPFSLRPEITLVSRGTRLNWLDVNYDFVANYVDLRLPITFNLDFLSEKYSPYIMVAPQLNIPYNGTITYSADDYPDPVSTPITKADIRAADLSLMLGAGIDIRVDLEKMPVFFSLEVGYNLGLLNNFAKRERAEATESPSNILNDFFGAELWHGSRHTRGLEIAARISLPIDSKYQQRYRDLRKGIPDTVRLVERQYDTIIGPNDTVIIEVERPIPEMRAKTNYQTKECFSIAELNNLMEQGLDITGKRICMFDIKFDFDSYKIRKESERPLNELIQMMHDYPQMTVEVYGHTDSIGTAEYNQRLSENRAKAVVEYISSHGVSPSRIKSFGYGLKYPIDTNSTEEGRFRNRRVEFEVITIGLNRRYKD